VDGDEGLARRAVAGDHAAFEALVARYQDRVYGLARRLTGSESDAEDVLQETFVSAYRRLKGFRGEAAFSTWLYRIATNCWLAHSRKRKEELLGDREESVADDSDEAADAADAGADEVSRAAALKLDLTRAMRLLTDAERAAIVQCYDNDLSHEEAAYVLGCPVGTVKTHIHRGKQKLKAAMSAWDGSTR